MCIFCSCQRQQGPKSYLAELGLKGKVRQITQYTYADEQSFKTNQPGGKTIFNFDSNGRLLNYMASEGIKNVVKYEKQRIVATAYLKDTAIGHVVALLDQNGRRLEEDYYMDESALPNASGVIRSRTLFKYNNDGYVAEEDVYDGGKAIGSKKTYVYNDKYQKIEERITSFDSANIAKTFKTVYSYDAAGNETSEKQYEGGELAYIQLNSYSNFDQAGNWLVRISNDTDNSTTKPGEHTVKSFIRREIKYFQ